METEEVWKIIDSYFKENPQALVTHHIESYNDFFKNGIYQIFKEKNPIYLTSQYIEEIDDYKHQAKLYMGGKDGSRIYFGKPVIYDDERPHYMYPNEARLRNMTYAMTIHYDIEVEYTDILEEGEQPKIIGGDDFAEEDDFIKFSNYKSLQRKDHEKGGQLEEDKERSVYDNQQINEQDNYATFFAELDNEKSGQSITGGGKREENARAKQEAEDAAKSDNKNIIVRKKQPKKQNLEMAPTDIAKIREATEKSIRETQFKKGKKEVTRITQTNTVILEKIYLGKFPIMVQSEFCILYGLPKEIRYSMGECKNDIGGYFIIDGKEKSVVPQEKFADNMLYIKKDTDKYLYTANIRSVSENVSKPIRTLNVAIKAPGAGGIGFQQTEYTNLNIVVNIPNVRSPVPLFILFRALGFLSDKEIITMCLLDIEKYKDMLELFRPSIHDAATVMTQAAALKYIAIMTKGKTTHHALEILTDYLFPHIGETNYIDKAYYLGYIVFRLLKVYAGIEDITNRDNYKFKRLETTGSLLYDLFREYYTIQLKELHLDFEKRLYFNQSLFADNLPALINKNYREVFLNRVVDSGFKKAFKGNWGAKTHTKRIGIVQDLNRLSHNSMLSQLRKTNISLDATAKVVGPRVLHCSQWGYFDPIDTPDGGNIGLIKNLCISTYVTNGMSREPMIQWLQKNVVMKLLVECSPIELSSMTRVFVNGFWCGGIEDPITCVEKIKLYRRNAIIPIHTSVSFDIKQNTIFIYTDAGRLSRPIFYKNMDQYQIENEKSKFGFAFENPKIMEKIKSGDFKWTDLITGFNPKRESANFKYNHTKIYDLNELYEGIDPNPAKQTKFIENKAIIDYIDTSESEDALIALNTESISSQNTHLEIHESFMFGMMCNLVIFPENNPATRNSFSCGQSKQAVSMYNTNFQFRMDKNAVVLNSGQVPLVKSRYLEYINGEENPYGCNAIVAIMIYSGYNMEDSILINEGALKRGLFQTTYYSTYETHEEKGKTDASEESKKIFCNIEDTPNLIGTKPGYDYSKLDKYGLINENTEVDDKTVLIGMITQNSGKSNIDESIMPKKGQLGHVDKSFITEGEEGERIAKVRVRDIRIPNLGDKMASRAGQKGTIGLVIPEADMPFTKDGLRPDLIINPHALPTRMTIGQLVECITGKASAMYGAYGDCTAFQNKGSKIGVYGSLLTKVGYHSSGNEVLYNGMTGEQLESEIFIGPTYYMRLKHMVKDKINYRALGPRTALTRQPVGGRANDGGLRIGEMERDGVLSHGMADFLNESMMERGDKYYMAICNTTGMIAIYNPAKNLFMSPMADGPIKFTGSLAGNDMNIENITKYGRSFSVICVPYSLKLFVQELQTMNIHMRFITDDNIDQIENMMFSKNIDKLTGFKDTTLSNYNDLIKENMRNVQIIKQPEKEIVNHEIIPPIPINPEILPSNPYMPHEFTDWSPEKIQDQSPEYAPNTISPPKLQLEEEREFFTINEIENKEEKKGGGEESYEVGEEVGYRGGDIKPRKWVVKNKGAKFVTIETDDMEGLESENSIQVVPYNYIFPYHENLFSINAHTLPNIQMQPQMQPQIQMQSHTIPTIPAIQSSTPTMPAINIVVGDNNKIDGTNEEKKQKGGEPMSDNIIITKSNENNGGSNIISNYNSNNSNNTNEKQDSTGVIDFTKGNFLIKKTG